MLTRAIATRLPLGGVPNVVLPAVSRTLPATAASPARHLEPPLPVSQPPKILRFDSDAGLVNRVLAGDQRAAKELFRRFQGRIAQWAFRILRNPHEVEDAVQEIFECLFRDLDKFRGDSLFSTWVYRITHNHCVNRLKYRNRPGRRNTESLVGEVSSNDPSPFRRVAASEEIERIDGALQTLSPDHRSMILWADVEGLSYEDLCTRTGLPMATVKSRLHRARQALSLQIHLRS